jgi:hypothetical protein
MWSIIAVLLLVRACSAQRQIIVPFDDLHPMQAPLYFLSEKNEYSDTVVYYKAENPAFTITTMHLIVTREPQISNSSKIAAIEGVHRITMPGFRLLNATSSCMGSNWEVTVPTVIHPFQQFEAIQSYVALDGNDSGGTLSYVSLIFGELRFFVTLFTPLPGYPCNGSIREALWTISLNS